MAVQLNDNRGCRAGLSGNVGARCAKRKRFVRHCNEFAPALAAGLLSCRPIRLACRSSASGEFFLRDLLQHPAFGLDADGKKGERSDQISEREGVQHVSAGAIGQHQANDRRRQE